MINKSIRNLIEYGLQTGLITKEDEIYATNLLLDVMKLSEYEVPAQCDSEVNLGRTLDELLDYAWEHGLMEDNGTTSRDLFDTRLMNCLMPRPGEVIRRFYEYCRAGQTA